MAIDNTKFDMIMRGYEETRRRNRELLEQRKREIGERIPEYFSLQSQIADLSVEYTDRIFRGESLDRSWLHDRLNEVEEQMSALLTKAGYPADYLAPIYSCQDCKDTGYLDEGRTRCHCLESKIMEVNYSSSNLRSLLEKAGFEHLSEDYYSGNDLALFRRAEEISKNACLNFGYQNLLFYGTVGTGKSFLSICIAKEYLKAGKSVLYFSSAELFDRIGEVAFSNQQKDAYHELKKDLIHADLLVIDDLGTELTNAFTASELFSIINERFLHSKSTIISTNLSLEDLRDRYSDRIFSRVAAGFTLLKLTGPDIRLATRSK